MSKKTYSSKLKNPLWQKTRLSVLEYANWRCQICGSKEKELHVHHSFYEKDKEPWEYDTSMMIAICDNCHEKIHSVSNIKETENLKIQMDKIYETLSVCQNSFRQLDSNKKSGLYKKLNDELRILINRYCFEYDTKILLAIEKYWVF